MEKELQMWRDSNPGKTINKYELIRTIMPALEKSLGNKSLIKEGFRASGLYVEGKGFDPSQVDFSRMKASEAFAQKEARDGDGLSATVNFPDASESLLPNTQEAETEITSMFVPVTSDYTPLASDVSSDPTFSVPRFPDIPRTSCPPAALVTSDVSRDPTLMTSAPAVPVTNDHTASVSSLFRAPIIPETSGPDVTEPGDHTAPIMSLFRDHTLPVTSVPAAPVSSELSAPVSSVSSAPPVTEASDTGVCGDNPLSEFEIPLEDRILRFQRFQTSMITSAAQIRKFEELFKKKDFKVRDIFYQAWLLFKLDSIGNEKEAFDHILKKRKPNNLEPKKKRDRVAPEGSGRYNMTDKGWDPIFKERMEKEVKNKKKVTTTKNKSSSISNQVGSRSAASSTVTSGALESLTSGPCSQLSSFTAPPSNDNSSNNKPMPGPAAASSTVTSEAGDSDLPDIPDLTVTNSLMRVTNLTSRGKRKGGSNNNNNNKPGNKRVKLRSNGSEVMTKITSTSMEISPSLPKFPLDNGVVPLIDDNDDNSLDNSSNNTQSLVTVASKAKSFLDIDLDLDLDTDLKKLNKSTAVPKIAETVNHNNNNNSTRTSRRLRARVDTPVTSETVTSMSASKAIPAVPEPNVAQVTSDLVPIPLTNTTKGRPSRSSTVRAMSTRTSQTSVAITVIDDGDEITDQNAKILIEEPAMNSKEKRTAKVRIKKEKK